MKMKPITTMNHEFVGDCMISYFSGEMTGIEIRDKLCMYQRQMLYKVYGTKLDSLVEVSEFLNDMSKPFSERLMFCSAVRSYFALESERNAAALSLYLIESLPSLVESAVSTITSNGVQDVQTEDNTLINMVTVLLKRVLMIDYIPTKDDIDVPATTSEVPSHVRYTVQYTTTVLNELKDQFFPQISERPYDDPTTDNE